MTESLVTKRKENERKTKTTWRARGGGFRRAYLTVNGCPSRVLATLRMFGEIAARSGRRAERTPADSDRADRLKANIVFSSQDYFQRRGHLTVCKVAFYRLTLPRTRLTKPRTSTEVDRGGARSGVRVLDATSVRRL